MQLLNSNILKVGLEINAQEPLFSSTLILISINKHKIIYNGKTYCVEIMSKQTKLIRLLTIEGAIMFYTKKDNIANYDRFIKREEEEEWIKVNR